MHCTDIYEFDHHPCEASGHGEERTVIVRSREQRLQGILKTILRELGQQAVDYINGDNGLKRFSDEFKDHVIDSLHLGRAYDKETRALIRAAKFMSYITFHNDTFVSADVDIILHQATSKKARVHDLRMRLGSLWMKAREQKKTASDNSLLTVRLKKTPIRFAEEHAINCSSDSSVGYKQLPRPGAPPIPQKPLYSMVSFRGNWRGAQPMEASKLKQTTMFLDVGTTTYSGISLKTVPVSRFYKGRREDEFGVYFLPWLSLKVATLQLPQPPPGASRFFCTSSLSGCSVFIEGPPQTPTVYHLGVDSSQHGKVGEFFDNAALPRGCPAGMTTAYRRKDAKAFWWALLSWKKGFVGTPADNHVVEVSKDDYLNSSRLRTLTQHILGNRAVTPDDETISTTGTVFGYWSGGGWNFYLQENAVIFGGRIKGQVNFPLCLSQVFPNKRIIKTNTRPPKHKLGLLS